MKITIKNLQQQTFCIDFDNTKTVRALKEAIFEDRGGDYTVDRQKLIYAGIILDDDRTLASYDVSEKKFIVVMLKRDIAAATTTTTKEGGEVSTKENECARKSDNNVQKAPTTTTTTTSSNAASASSTISPSSGLVMGDEYQRSVNSMIEMGYSRELVERAMAASFNNPERAVEYLISGIPESTEFSGFGGIDATGDAVSSHNPGITRATAGEDPFEFLRNQPQFLQMRSLVYQNPDLLQAVLRQIGNTNPALLQLISENQDAFLNMLNQPLDSTETGASPTSGTAAGGGLDGNRRAQMEAVTRAISGGNASAAAAASGVESTPPTTEAPVDNPQTVTLSLTANDKQAIERLKAMGFPEALVLQAYFACEKDEQLAANFLITSAFDD